MKSERTKWLIGFLTAIFIAACSGGMSEDDIRDHATRYTAAWNSSVQISSSDPWLPAFAPAPSSVNTIGFPCTECHVASAIESRSP